MKKYWSILLTTVVLMSINPVTAQKKSSRIQPGRMYQSGDTLRAPRLGFTAYVPQGWEGTLPRESEVFLLTSTTDTYGEMFVFGNANGDLNSLKNKWINGFALSESVNMKAVNPEITNGLLISDVSADGYFVNKGYRAFSAARCNPNGPCVIILMFAPSQFFEAAKNISIDFLSKGNFEAPSNISPYADFDWKEFLSNKVLLTLQSLREGEKQNTIHLCADGTFTSFIKHTGMFKNQNPLYRGKNSGTWEVTGNGANALIRFTFKDKKLAPFEAPLLLDDERILSNGDRYYVGNSDKCGF